MYQYFQNTREQRGGRKRKEKKNEQERIERNWGVAKAFNVFNDT